MKGIRLAVWLFVLTGSAIGQTRSAPAPADEIRGLDQEIITAYDRKDVAAVQRIFGEDARMVHSDGRVTTKQDELKNVTSALPPEVEQRWRAEEIEVRLYAGMAVSLGTAVQEGRYKGEPFTRKYRYTYTYISSRGKWQLISAQYSRVPDK